MLAREKGQSALRHKHSFTWSFGASEGRSFLNLVAELSGVRSGLMFLSCLAMFTALVFTGIGIVMPKTISDINETHAATEAFNIPDGNDSDLLDPNASVNDTNMMNILSMHHKSAVALFAQEEIAQLLRDQQELAQMLRETDRLLENGPDYGNGLPVKRELRSFPVDDQNNDCAGKSLVMYDPIRASAQDERRMHDVQHLREHVRRFREKARSHFESPCLLSNERRI